MISRSLLNFAEIEVYLPFLGRDQGKSKQANSFWLDFIFIETIPHTFLPVLSSFVKPQGPKSELIL